MERTDLGEEKRRRLSVDVGLLFQSSLRHSGRMVLDVV